MRPLLLAPFALLAFTAACGKAQEEGASLSLTTANGAGGSVDPNGRVKIDTPVFQGSFNLPQMKLDAANFDINGVHLYPGTKIKAVNVDAAEDDGRVVVRFDSPAAPATVRDWLLAEFKKAGTEVSPAGAGLKGTDEEGKGFTIDLAPAGQGASGTLRLG